MLPEFGIAALALAPDLSISSADLTMQAAGVQCLECVNLA